MIDPLEKAVNFDTGFYEIAFIFVHVLRIFHFAVHFGYTALAKSSIVIYCFLQGAVKERGWGGG